MLIRLSFIIALILPLSGCLWAIVTTPVIMGGKAVYNETVAETEGEKLDLRPWWFQWADNIFGPENDKEEDNSQNS